MPMKGRALLPPIHPGEILQEEFMVPMGISTNALAKHLDVPANRISQIIRGKRALTADTALRLAAAFGNTPKFWLNLQSLYDLELAERAGAAAIRRQVQRIDPPEPGAPGLLHA